MHYENLLAPIYSWMVGGIDSALERGAAEIDEMQLKPNRRGGLAVDLGAGFGVHAIPLARAGYQVIAIDSSRHLLDELLNHKKGRPIEIIEADLLSFPDFLPTQVELITCMGDTLPHLDSEESVAQLVEKISANLHSEGKFVVTLRDYSKPLLGTNRFIPVKSDDSRIHTCFLEYEKSHVSVFDIVYEKKGSEWRMRTSAYRKLRIAPTWLLNLLLESGLVAQRLNSADGLIRIIARKRLS